MSELDPRIGRYNADGSYDIYPQVNIYNRAASRPPESVIRLDALHFVIAPAGFNDEDAIEEIRRSLPTIKAPRRSPSNE